MSWIDQLFGGDGDGIFSDTRRAFDILTDPRTWFRAFMVIFGLVLILAALRY